MLTLHHLALRTAEPEALIRFYRELFDLRVLRETDSGTWLSHETETPIVMIERKRDTEPSIPDGTRELVAWTISLADKDAWLAKLSRLGIAIEERSAYTLYFRDPDGRRVALSHYEARKGAVPSGPTRSEPHVHSSWRVCNRVVGWRRKL